MERQWPYLIHVEEESLVHPNWMELDMLYGKNLSWPWRTKNYAVHLWFHMNYEKHDLNSVKTLNNTMGAMLRYVLYGEL